MMDYKDILYTTRSHIFHQTLDGPLVESGRYEYLCSRCQEWTSDRREHALEHMLNDYAVRYESR